MASSDEMIEETQMEQHGEVWKQETPGTKIDGNGSTMRGKAPSVVNVSDTMQQLKRATERSHATLMTLEFKRQCLLKDGEKIRHFQQKHAEVSSALKEAQGTAVEKRGELQVAKEVFERAQNAFMDAKRQHTESSVTVFVCEAELEDIDREIAACKDRMQGQTKEILDMMQGGEGSVQKQ